MKMQLRTIAALLTIRGASAQLHQLAVAAGKLYFGSATDNGELTDSAYVDILADRAEFGQITPGNGQKWQFTEPSQGEFDYESGDEIVRFAGDNGQIVRCHTLVWHSQLPSWVSSGSWTAEELTAVLETHIANEVGHYKGQCYSWDVVNEALEEDGTFRASVFYEVLGESFIPIAFRAAAAADPDARLYYNDYNIEAPGPKQSAAADIVRAITDAGAPVHGVGMQAHLIVGNVPNRSDLEAAIASYLDAGAEEVAYTELDIRHASLPPTQDALQAQADDYAVVAAACLAVDQCVGITVWDYTDRYSWIPHVFPGSGAALPYDEDLGKKPAWTAVSSVLAAAAAATATPTL